MPFGPGAIVAHTSAKRPPEEDAGSMILQLQAALCGVETESFQRKPGSSRWHCLPVGAAGAFLLGLLRGAPVIPPALAQRFLNACFQQTVVTAAVQDMRVSVSGSIVLDALACAAEHELCLYMNSVDIVVQEHARKVASTSATDETGAWGVIGRLLSELERPWNVLAALHALLCGDLHGISGEQAVSKLFALRFPDAVPEAATSLAPPPRLVAALLTATVAPVSTMVERWLFDGVLHDPTREFFVLLDRTTLSLASIVSDNTMRVAGSRYVAVAHKCPDFLRDIAYDILHAGAYRSMLSDDEELQQLLGAGEFGTSAGNNRTGPLVARTDRYNTDEPGDRFLPQQQQRHRQRRFFGSVDEDDGVLLRCLVHGDPLGSLRAEVTAALAASSAAVMARLFGSGRELALHAELMRRVILNSDGDWGADALEAASAAAASGLTPTLAWRVVASSLGGDESPLGALFVATMFPSTTVVVADEQRRARGGAQTFTAATLQYLPPPYMHLAITPEVTARLCTLFHWLHRWRVAVRALGLSGFCLRPPQQPSLGGSATGSPMRRHGGGFSSAASAAASDRGVADDASTAATASRTRRGPATMCRASDQLFLFSLHGAMNRLMTHLMQHYVEPLLVELRSATGGGGSGTVEECRLAVTHFAEGLVDTFFQGYTVPNADDCTLCALVVVVERIVRRLYHNEAAVVSKEDKATTAKYLRMLCAEGSTTGVHIDFR